MKSIKLSHNNYFDIEQIIRKIAEENDIKDIKNVQVKLSKEEGLVKFSWDTAGFKHKTTINGIEIDVRWDENYNEYSIYFPQIKEFKDGVPDQIIRISESDYDAMDVLKYTEQMAEEIPDVYEVYRKVYNFVKAEIYNKSNKASEKNNKTKFAIIDDWAEYPEDFGNEPIDSVIDTDHEDDAVSTGPRYTIYYNSGLNMNGQGIDYIIDNEFEERMSTDEGLEAIIEDLGETHPEFHEYEFGIYVGGDFSGPSLDADYDVDTPDDAVDKINDWLWKNTSFEKIGGEE